MEKKTQKLQSDEAITWAYAVLDSYAEAFNRVASAKPEEKQRLKKQLEIERIKKLPKLYEALTILMPREHQPILYQFFTAELNMIESLSKFEKAK